MADPLIIFFSILVIACLILALWLIFKKAMTIIKTVVINSVVGLVALFLLSIIGIQIPVTTATILAIAIFGLPALGTILLLMFFGAL